jgi:hypothetical protein
MKEFHGWLVVACAFGVLFASACSKSEDPAEGAPPPAGEPVAAPGAGAPSQNPGGGGASAPGATAGVSAPSATAGASAMAGSGSGSGNAGAGVPPEVMEMLDPDVDWTALTLVYPTLYSAYDGEHTFQVPVHVDMATVELSDWQAIPSSAVTIDPDPEGGGIMLTIVEPVAEITVAARSGMIGGTAPLHVTIATPEDWTVGEARYHNGVDYTLPMLDFAQLIDPNWTPPPTPENLACNNCHTTGAKYFEIQHTPTQIARISDQDLITIFTTGMKPPGVTWSVIPPEFQHLYEDFHHWEATEAEQKGLIVFLRSLTPTGQGDIMLPDGTFTSPPMP